MLRGFHPAVNDGTGASAFYAIVEQEFFPSDCIGPSDIFGDIVGYGAPAIQQVVLHIWLLIFGIGHCFGQKAPTCRVHFNN